MEQKQVKDFLSALTFEEEREVRHTERILRKDYHVFYLRDEYKAKFIKDVIELNELYKDEKTLKAYLIIISALEFITDLPREILNIKDLERIFNKPNRSFERILSAVVQEISESTDIDSKMLESIIVSNKAKEKTEKMI